VDDTSDLVRQRLEKLDRLREKTRDPFAITRFDRTHTAAEVVGEFARLEGQRVRAAGRLVALRRHGKATFAHLEEASGRLQLYFRQDALGEAYEDLSLVDLGDFLGAEGRVFRTRTGEVTVEVQSYTVLAKALRPLPEKWHGLKDVELRYRQRYADLLANREVRETFAVRSRVVRAIREFLEARGFLEVETPMMQSVPGGAAARPFITHHNALDIDLYLRVAPELYLKRLIVGGFERVFEINRNFRNEGISTRHNPEFTMLEVYQAYADYHDMMTLTEELVAHAARSATGGTRLHYQGEEIELAPPWHRVTFYQALERHADLKRADLESADSVRRICRQAGLPAEPELTLATMVNNLFERFVEPNLVEPTFVMDYPTAISPLAKAKAEDPGLVERFEPFIAAQELGNAFSELNDPVEQRRRFEEQARARAAGDEEAHPMDEDFLRALEYGMPPTGGLGIGIDRLVMILTDSASIREVILFPQMRPER
jgi:lysyl-tRNA synthetase class 2